MKQNILRLLPFVLLGLSVQLWAQTPGEDVVWPRIQEFTWMDQNYLAKQKQFIDDMVGTEFGRPVRGDKSDLRLLQRIVNRGLIEKTAAENLQALGAVLGDVYVHEFDVLEWRIYEDQKGRSRAVCILDTSNCLFPITMLSRRIEAGLTPDVEAIYDKGVEAITPYLPKTPFSATNPRR